MNRLQKSATIDPLSGDPAGLDLSPLHLVDRVDDAGLRLRTQLARRLIDVIALPSSRISPQERYMCSDLLLELLDDGGRELKAFCARRIADLHESSKPVLRSLACEPLDISRPILEDCTALDQADLIAIAVAGDHTHRLAIAGRNPVDEAVTEVLADPAEPLVALRLLANPHAKFSLSSIEALVAASRMQAALVGPILHRPELKSSQALIMYWWATTAERQQILRRFAIERKFLLESAGDLFGLARGGADPVVTRVMDFIERRQRDRDAATRSAYPTLEAAIDDAAANGLGPELRADVIAMCGIRENLGRRILADLGGEPIGVLCKSVGLKRKYLSLLWLALGREIPSHQEHSPWERTLFTYDSLSTQKAQTVLRYWSWSIRAAGSAELREADAQA